MKPELSIVSGSFTIHRFDPATPIPAVVAAEPFCWVARTEDELSIVCRSTLELDSGSREPGWACLEVRGPLDFELTGLLAGIATVLARAGVSIFALSTFDTDYVLVKTEALNDAVTALREASYSIG